MENRKIQISVYQYQQLIKKLQILETQNQSLKNKLNKKQIANSFAIQDKPTNQQNLDQSCQQNNLENSQIINNCISQKDKHLLNRSQNQKVIRFKEQSFSQQLDEYNNVQKNDKFQDQSNQSVMDEGQQQAAQQQRQSIQQQTKQIYKKQQSSIYLRHRENCMKALKSQSLQDVDIDETQNQNVQQQQKESEQKKSEKNDSLITLKLNTIQQICLYGPNFEDIYNNNIQNCHVNSSLIYCSKTSQQIIETELTNDEKIESNRFQKYRHSLFPQKVQIKKVKQQKQPTETGRIIHKKNAKRQDVCTYIFQAQENHLIHKQRKQNITVEIANPNPSLYAFAVHFTDYICLSIIQKQECITKEFGRNSMSQQKQNPQGPKYHRKLQKLHRMQSLIPCPSKKQPVLQNQKSQPQNIQINQQILENNQSLYLGRFCLCIFSYFPMVNLFQKILSKIIEEIKIKRMEAYASNPQDLKSIDVRYLSKQLRRLSEKLVYQVNQIPVSIDSWGICEIQGKQMKVDFSLENIMNEMYTNWPYQILKLFDKDTLYQTICCVLFDQSVCFLSQDTHILTYCILLFVDLLIRPFYSPHPSCSIMLQQQFLSAPFIVNMGVPKSTQWYQENKNLFDSKKVIIDLNSGQAKFRTKRNAKNLKSQKLRKIISSFYKRMRGNESQILLFTLKQKKSCVSTYNSFSTKQQNESFFILLTSIQNMFQQQLLAHLPACSQIDELKKMLSDKHQSEIAIRREVFKHLQAWVRQSRKKEYKDQLANAILDQQIFYEYGIQKYGLQ